MRRMSIDEVGLQLEHVLFMPTETLQNLIIISCYRWFHLSSYLMERYPIIALTTDTSSAISFRCFVTIEEDDLLLSNSRECGCAILLFMFGVMIWVRDGVATIPTTLIICSSDTEYVDQCVTLTPSSFVSPEQATLVSGVEKINMEREDL